MKNKTIANRISSTSQSTGVTAEGRPIQHVILSLYIAGFSPRSTLALERIRRICDRFLTGRYELTVIDLYVNPEMARQAQIIVAPTLVKESPSPKRIFIGDMSDENTIIRGLDIVASTFVAVVEASK